MRPLLLLLHLFHLSLPLTPTRSQTLLSPPPLSLPITLPYSSFTLLQLPPNPNPLLIEWTSSSPPILSTHSQPDLILSLSPSTPPLPPNTTTPPCSQFNPCLPPLSDSIAFNTHANRAALLFQSPSQPLFIRIENYPRARTFQNTPLRPTLTGALRIQAVSTANGPVCGRDCERHGVCEEGEDEMGGVMLGVCRCTQGWTGRFCDVETVGVEEEEDGVESGTQQVGGVESLAGGVVVEGGMVYRWRFRKQGFVRARVLGGRVVVGGELVQVGLGGGGSGMWVGRGGVWKVGDLVVGRNGNGGEGDVYEWVSGVAEGEWLVWLMRNVTVGEGEVLYSVRSEECGEGGVVCERGDAMIGVYIGLGVVSAVAVVVAVVYWCCWWRVRKGGGGGEEGGGAWDSVELGKFEERKAEGSSGSTVGAGRA